MRKLTVLYLLPLWLYLGPDQTASSRASADLLPPSSGSSCSSSRRSSSTFYPPPPAAAAGGRLLLTPLLNLPAPPEAWGPPSAAALSFPPDRTALSPFAIYTPGSALSLRSSMSSRSVASEASTIFGPEKEHALGERMRVIVDAFRTRAWRVKKRLEQPPTPSADFTEEEEGTGRGQLSPRLMLDDFKVKKNGIRRSIPLLCLSEKNHCFCNHAVCEIDTSVFDEQDNAAEIIFSLHPCSVDVARIVTFTVQTLLG